VKHHTASSSIFAVAMALFPLAVSADDFTYFEAHIRPVLVEKCYGCHSAESQSLKGEFRLDTKDLLLKGGKSGKPAIVPGNADGSPLIEALRYKNKDRQMPPKGPLPDDVVEKFVVWVNAGAPDPRTGEAPKLKANAKDFWSFKDPVAAAPPRVVDTAWCATPIDSFILAKLEANGLKPAPMADKYTLIRRLSYDLTGLPPNKNDVDAFLQDGSADAYEKMVDRLLAAPQYGERWGRMWLDVARYADTKGYVYGDREDPRFLHSYVYRDWVIRAFNEDMPYDRFVMLQLAADKLVDGADKRDLAAMGLLTLGRRFLGVVPDIIDDRIDVVMRGVQGLTVGCARCHDHKFDPISTRDYYALYGVFNSSSERTICLDDAPEKTEAFAEYEKSHAERVKKLQDTFQAKRNELADRLRDQMPEYMVALLDVENLPTDDFYEIRQAADVVPTVARTWQTYIDKRQANDPVWGLWKAGWAIPDAEFAAKMNDVFPVFLANTASSGINAAIAHAFAAPWPATRREFAERYGKALKGAHEEWAKALKEATEKKVEPPKSLGDPALEALRQELYAESSPVIVPNGAIVDVEWYFDEPTRVELSKLQKEIDNNIVDSAGAPPHAVVLEDKPLVKNARVFVRGNPANQGDEVPRAFPAVLRKDEPKTFSEGSGRLELAKAIAGRENPLTARVLVNRVWLEHFGSALVNTPSDFGTRSESPTHPELLDWLAVRFMDDGWSIKKLHRVIVSSSTYRQSSISAVDASASVAANAPSAAKIDPENKLYWHFNRRRLTFEEMRDALLAATGELDLTVGGRPVQLTDDPFPVRRTVYGYVDRQFLPGIYRVFDYPNPDMHSPKRFDTTVPQQALFLMNSPFLMGRAKALAANTLTAHNLASDRARSVYHAVFQREPDTKELSEAMQFLAESAPLKLPEPPKITESPWHYGFGELDTVRLQLVTFEKLPHFTGDTWQGGSKWPDAELGWLRLNATSGHPGDNHKHDCVRRWIAPVNGTVSITAELKHPNKPGDGVQGFIFASGQGLLGTWSVHDGKADTSVANVRVKKGDCIDFVVDMRENISSDDHDWAPEITLMEPPAEMKEAGLATVWNATKDFAGQPPPVVIPLSPWEQYAQVLLLSNEFMFVD
jgi:hypothetical protein